MTEEYSEESSSSSLILFLFIQVCSLERFRSLQDKLLLLEEAVSMHDGNVITAVSCGFCLLFNCFLLVSENPIRIDFNIFRLNVK